MSRIQKGQSGWIKSSSIDEKIEWIVGENILDIGDKVEAMLLTTRV